MGHLLSGIPINIPLVLFSFVHFPCPSIFPSNKSSVRFIFFFLLPPLCTLSSLRLLLCRATKLCPFSTQIITFRMICCFFLLPPGGGGWRQVAYNEISKRFQPVHVLSSHRMLLLMWPLFIRERLSLSYCPYGLSLHFIPW